MTGIKILMLARSDLLSYPGGDTTQILRTAEALQTEGLVIDINPEKIQYEDYDLVHFFNIIDPEDILGHLKHIEVPYVVSTIYCLYEEYDRHHRKDAIGLAYRLFSRNGVEYLKTVGKWIIKGNPLSSYSFLWKGHRRSIQEILKGAACLLPNSESEYQRLLGDYGIDKSYVVVPNGVDVSQFSPRNNQSRQGVLCVSRIEGRKNQLNLIKAINDTHLDLYLVGTPAHNQPAYYEECKRIAGKNIHFVGYVSDEELYNFYEKSLVHVLPSWFETTGLASLEAALMGCKIVISDRGDVRDYFGDDVWYCNPDRPESIRAAILKAYESPGNDRLVQRIRENFTWKIAAQKTMEAYDKALIYAPT